MGVNSAKKKASGNSLKALATKRRQVFKPVLDNPFNTSYWPEIAPELQEEILKQLLNFLKSNYSHDSLLTGFNKVTGSLELQAKLLQKNQPIKDEIKYVIICRNDIKPQILLDHFPVLCYTASLGFYKDGKKVKLITLPKNSKDLILNVLSSKFSGILALNENVENLPGFDTLLEEINKVKDLKIEWLDNNQKKNSFFKPPVIKVLKTTVPVVTKK